VNPDTVQQLALAWIGTVVVIAAALSVALVKIMPVATELITDIRALKSQIVATPTAPQITAIVASAVGTAVGSALEKHVATYHAAVAASDSNSNLQGPANVGPASAGAKVGTP
jgi:hypothetical protein